MELELLKNYKLALKNSVEINEDNFTKKNNLSELAINSKLKAVEAEPKNINDWKSLFYVISVDRYLQDNEEITISNYFKNNYSEIISIFISLLEYKLSLEEKFELYYSKALEVIGSKGKIKNNRFKKYFKEKLFLPKKTIALFHLVEVERVSYIVLLITIQRYLRYLVFIWLNFLIKKYGRNL